MPSTGYGRQLLEDGRRPAADGGRSAVVGESSTIDGGRSTDDRRQSTDDGGQSTIDGRRSARDEGQSAYDGRQSTEDCLLYTSDRSGWWNLYRDHQPVCPREEEFGGALWKLGQRWFAPLESGLVAVVHGRGSTVLGILDPETGELVDAAGPWTEFAPTLAVQGERVVGVAASPRSAYEVVELDARTGRARVVGAAHDDAVDPAYYPEPRIRTFTGPDGRDIHAHVYPPHHPGQVAPGHELPPYVVWAHGGPTDRAPLVLDLEIAYFTSRGIGVAEVDYGGSTGYGREYRERLREQWGVVDVEDCAAVALALADEGTADRRMAGRPGRQRGRLDRRGLAGLHRRLRLRHDPLPRAGPGGLGDGRDPRLRVALPGQSRRAPRAGARPVRATFADRARRPDHRAVPAPPGAGRRDLPARPVRAVPGPAGRAAGAARVPGVRGEGHGFRRAATMVRALEAELSLYAQAFGLCPPGIPRLELVR